MYIKSTLNWCTLSQLWTDVHKGYYKSKTGCFMKHVPFYILLYVFCKLYFYFISTTKYILIVNQAATFQYPTFQPMAFVCHILYHLASFTQIGNSWIQTLIHSLSSGNGTRQHGKSIAICRVLASISANGVLREDSFNAFLYNCH